MKRAIVVVIDSMGVGAMPDYAEFNDIERCNTLKNVAKACGGLNLPNMQKLGLGNIEEVEGVEKIETPIGQYGIMKEKSKGKDTTIGHWEIAGLVSEKPFSTFPDGFGKDILDEFIEKTNCGGVLGNKAASGTAIIEELNDEHQKTKHPIIYTSADSVFQIAVDIDVIPLETLYEWCKVAREMFNNSKYVLSRVIARPYHIENGNPVRISKFRRDYSFVPPEPTLLNEVQKSGGQVVAIGKIEDIFTKSGVTHAIHTGSNKEGLELTLDAITNKMDLDKIKIAEVKNPNKSFIFTNLVDTDMLFGHRNDAKGYGKAIEEIDTYIPKMIEAMNEDDLLIITADHGCDPTVPGTDHTREMVPVIYYNKNIEPKDLGVQLGFDNVAKSIRKWFDMA